MKCFSLVMALFLALCVVQNAAAAPPFGYGYEGYSPYAQPRVFSNRQQVRLRIERTMSDEGYVLKIHLGENTQPEAIQVSIQGRSLLIESKQSMQTEESSEEGYYSYSRSSSSFRRRISTPRDADVEKMQRTDEKGLITILLPFLNST